MSSPQQPLTSPPVPVDLGSASMLAAGGLAMGLVDTGDREAFATWLQAEARGFHDSHMSEASVTEQFEGIGHRRTTGVWDATAAQPEVPVATVSSWPSVLTVPGNRPVNAWAISAVSVAPTHRRRGIARAMLEAELRTAHAQGHPVAVLTVSEATIYGRYGFAPTAMSADLSIDTTRARWTGARPDGRVHFVSLDSVHTDGRALLERVRVSQPGQLEMSDYHWDRKLGRVADTEDNAKKLRAVRYDDRDGAMQGFAIYSVTSKDLFRHALDISYLVTATDDAAAALWQFLLEQDLVTTVTAPLRPVDDPIAWQVADFRAVSKTSERDHLWARILDVPAALAARNYAAPASIVLDVADPLGFAEGRYLLEIAADGAATVTTLDDAAELQPTITVVALGAAELAALYLGGVTAHTLLRAGRLAERTPNAAEQLDAAFHTAAAPFCDFWF